MAGYVADQVKGIASGVFILSAGGHLTTWLTGLVDSDRIKPHMVRFLDNKVMDPVRKLIGKAPTEKDLHQRKLIYDKMDNEFAGKSEIGMWGSRAAGLGTVVGSMTLLGMGDVLVHPKNRSGVPIPFGDRGFRSLPSGF